MKKLVLFAFASVPAFLLAAGCGGGSSSSGNPSNSTYTLSDGTYDYVATSDPTNTCWAPPKTTIALPMTIAASITVNGNDVTITGTQGGVTGDFHATMTGNALAGTVDQDADLNQASTPIDCVLHIHGVLNGTMTANDEFDATNTIDVSEVSGNDCGLLVGNSFDQQLDSLPCELQLVGHATKQ